MKSSFKIIALVLLLVTGLSAQNRVLSPQERYISQYAGLAVEEMYRSGVPASITLAQGLLESRYGLSELAVNGNDLKALGIPAPKLAYVLHELLLHAAVNPKDNEKPRLLRLARALYL
jgi:hypothetical protein